MKYYSEEILRQYIKNSSAKHILEVIDEIEPYIQEGKTVPATINVRFCRYCPFFEIYGLQPDPDIRYGWCRRMSYYETLDNEYPHFVYVSSNSFCDEDDITEEDY